MIRPNFFIVGAAKAGTTSMFYYLNQHPRVFLSPIKEPNYFATDIDESKLRPELRAQLKAALRQFRKSRGTVQLHIAHISDKEEYLNLFQGAESCEIVGECSVSYLPSPAAASNIHAFNPNARIVIMLRNPVWRAFSQYRMDKKLGSVTSDFHTAVLDDLSVRNPAWGVNRNYVWNGMYAEQVLRYMEKFSRNQIHFVFFEDLKCNTEKEVNRVFSFLGIEAAPAVEVKKKFNKAARPRMAGLNRVIYKSGLKPLIKGMLPEKIFRKISRWYYVEDTVKISDDEIKFLCDLYREDVLRLSGIVGRDLSNWVNSELILQEYKAHISS